MGPSPPLCNIPLPLVCAPPLPLLSAVIQALVALVHDPEPEHPLRGDLAEEYSKHRDRFYKNAEDHTRKYAEKRPQD